MDQPILGSLAWMNYNMSKVHPVFDAAQESVYTNENLEILTDESGNELFTEVIGQELIRWM